MTSIVRVGRDALPGGHSSLDWRGRSRSRGDLDIERGRDYGKGTHSSRFEGKDRADKTKGDHARGEEVGPESEMFGDQ